MSFNTIPEILEDIRAGRMVVILDDEDRENEGDLIMAAQMVRPEDINFMVREARGLVCLTLNEQRTRLLGLKPMVIDNTSPYQTNFTVSIEAAEGVTTGISAHDRARTIQVAVKSDAKPQDLSQPGHIFPLTAQPGGVLTRAGHTEAGCDLAALAGLEPSAVLIEILHEDGSMARRPELEVFAKKHGLKIGTIADLIRYRLETEKTVAARLRRRRADRVWPVPPGGLSRCHPSRPAFRPGSRHGERRRAGADPRTCAQYAFRRAASAARRSWPYRHVRVAPHCR